MHKRFHEKYRKQATQKSNDVDPKRNIVVWIWIVIAVLLIAITTFGIWITSEKGPEGPVVTVYKSPTCGCCKKWVKHLESEGFSVEAHNVRNMDRIKKQFGVIKSHQSCHTALVNGYAIEGHVPAADIKTLIMEKHEIKGLVVPGMPIGSPGMEGRSVEHYEVLSIDKGNRETVFNAYN